MIPLLFSVAMAGGQVEGFVFGPDGAPQAGIPVQVGSTEGTTDPSGRFVLAVEAGTWTLTVPGGSTEVRVSDAGRTEVLVSLTDGPPGFLYEQPEEVVLDATPDVVREVRGRVLGVDGRPLAGIRVFVRGSEGMQRTDADGRFVLGVPAESATLTAIGTGFTTLERALAADEEDVELTLVEAPRALATYTVTAPYVEGSVAGLLDARKEGAAVADVLGADEMSRAGDSDAASALSRVTGLTVVDGKYVFVRGLGDRYSSSLLDGAVLPSPEPERRVVPLDLFPTSVLSGVVVQKTWSPEMPGEFGGGVVQLGTIEPPTSFTASVGLSGQYRHQTTFTEGLTGMQGPTDWLGFDGGYRSLPDSVADASATSPLEEGDQFSDRGYTPSELEALGEAMPNRWSPGLRSLPPGFGVNGSIGGGFDRGDLEGGVLAAFTFGNDWQRLGFDRTYYSVGSNDTLRIENDYRFDQTSNEVSFGGFLTGGLSFQRTRLSFTSMLSRSSEDVARVYQGRNNDVGGDIRVTRLRWVERQLLWNRLGGEHDLGDLQVDWHAVVATASRLEPDRSETRYDNEQGTDRWLLSDRPEGNGRFYSAAGELDLEAAGGLVWQRREDGPKLKAGARLTARSRGVDTRRFKYFHKGPASRDQDVLQQDPEEVFVPENIGSNGFQFEEFTRQTDNYSASHVLLAGYLDSEIPLPAQLTLTAGARVEGSRQQVQTFELFNPDQVPVLAELNTVDLLPAVGLTWAPAEQVRLRLGGARTVSRPDFRELSPATFNDVTGGRQTFGNPDLQRARIDHGDLRLEWYPRSAEVFSIGAFVKRFSLPVETVVVASANQSVSWDNAEQATNVGVELEARRNLPLNLWAATNVALIRSRVTLAEGGVQTSRERRLQGQSPYVLNVQAGWEHPDRGDRLTALLNVVGSRITEVGAYGAPDILELPTPQLDLVGRKALGERWSASLKLKNVLNPALRTVQGDSTIDAIQKGWSGSVGISWSAE